MTLLYYLRSSNGSQTASPYEWDKDDLFEKRKKKKESLSKKKKLEKEKLEAFRKEVQELEAKALEKARKRRDEEDLLLLLMDELDEFDA